MEKELVAKPCGERASGEALWRKREGKTLWQNLAARPCGEGKSLWLNLAAKLKPCGEGACGKKAYGEI